MTRGQVWAWFRESKAMWGMVVKFREQIEQMQASIPLVEASGNSDQYMKVSRELAQAQQQYNAMESKVLERWNTSNLDSVEQASLDLELRLENVNETFAQWRKRLQQLEFYAATDQFDESGAEGTTSRADAETIVTHFRTEYEAALELAEQCIPNKAVVLHA